MRGHRYCIRALELKYPGIERRLEIDPDAAFEGVTVADVPLLYWTGASWGAAIAIGLDRPALVADLPAVKALMTRALVLQEDYRDGTIHEALITLEGVPEAMGGSQVKARAHFARAIELAHRPIPARIWRWRRRLRCRHRIVPSSSGSSTRLWPSIRIEIPANRLMTLISQKRARLLRSRIDQLFAPPG